MTEEQAKELHDIKIAKAREELKALQLGNLERKIDINNKISTQLALGLQNIDSDFRIEMDGVLLIKQESGKVEFGDVDEVIDNAVKKKLIPPPPSKEKSEGPKE